MAVIDTEGSFAMLTYCGDSATEPHMRERCATCGRELWSDGLPPARDGKAWICGDCDQARNFDALDLQADDD
jgi:hypothetical protein